MAYQALARKWRPQDFVSLVGQEPVVTALRNALREGRIAQAYLFAGIRGVGKTSAARILAKALNCQEGPTPDPCNDCIACREITAGADLDVIEIDAATYSKVEQVRELTESLRYGPARGRYKVVILDEVHRLSRQAFDALLKIVEEPPPYLVFLFATTEIEAVPATILSRCQELHFRRVAAAPLAEHLAMICEGEQITASPTALRLVARAGEGSVRDAVALLDQLATYGVGEVAEEAAARLLGGFDPDLSFRLLGALLHGDGASISAAVALLESEGRDPRQLYSHFLAYVRDALHLALGEGSDRLELPPDEVERLAALAQGLGYENLLRLLHQLLASEALLRRSEVPHLALEIALLKAAELPKLLRIEDLLGGGPGEHLAPAGPAPPALGATLVPTIGASSQPLPAPATGGPPPVQPTPAASLTPAAGAPPAAVAGVEGFLQEVARRRQMLAAHLAESEAVRFENGELLIVRKPDDSYLERALQREGNRVAVAEAVAEIWGADASWQVLAGTGATPSTAAVVPASAADEEAAQRDPRVQTVLDIFNGSVRNVEPQTPAEEE